MKFIKIIVATGLLLAAAFGCKPGPRPIDYGTEACEYCRMSIVDDRYAAQLVSKKGKTYSFDAIECMIHFEEENQDHEWHMELVTDFMRPGTLVPAEGTYIVHSKQLPSPMGMYLTAVGSKEEAEKLQKEHEGTVYRYQEVAQNMDNLPVL